MSGESSGYNSLRRPATTHLEEEPLSTRITVPYRHVLLGYNGRWQHTEYGVQKQNIVHP